MNPAPIRNRLHEQIDRLPDELVEQVADFVLFLAVKQKNSPDYHNWEERQWQEFTLQQFFQDEAGEEPEVDYSLKDAREVYHT